MGQDWTLLRVWCGVVGVSELCLIFGCLTLMLVQILSTLSLLNMQYMRVKRRDHEERVRKVKHATFVPLVFSATGRGKTATSFYKRLSLVVSKKRNAPYSVIMAWIRCRLGFALVRSAIASLRSHQSRPVKTTQPASTVINCCESCRPCQLVTSCLNSN